MPPHPATIDREEMLLVVIDIQDRLAAVMPERERVIARTSQLARACALVGAPIVITRQYPTGLGDTEHRIAETMSLVEGAGASVIRIDKTAFSACGEPAFVSAVEASGRGQAVIAGMETHICVVQTALDLVASGMRVQVVADACCAREAEAHSIALDRLRAAGVVVTTTESVLYEAVGVAATDEFRALLGIVKAG